MCNPVALGIASFALGAGQTIANFAGQRRQAAQQTQLHNDNAEASIAAAKDRYISLATRYLQEREKATQARFEAGVQGNRARGSVVAQASNAGVEGNSVNALVQDYWAQEGRAKTATDRNFEITGEHLRGEADATRHQSQARIHGVPVGQNPSVASLFLGIGASALNGFSVYNDMRINA